MKISLKREREIENELKELIKLKDLGLSFDRQKYKELLKEYKELKETKNNFLIKKLGAKNDF